MHVFLVRSAFEYFFCESLIHQKNISSPIFIIRRNECAPFLFELAKKNYRVFDLRRYGNGHFPRMDVLRKALGLKKIISKLSDEDGRTISLYFTSYYKATNYCVEQCRRTFKYSSFYLIPISTNFLLPSRNQHKRKMIDIFEEWLVGVKYTPLSAQRGLHGCADFISKVYSFNMGAGMHVPKNKVEFIDFGAARASNTRVSHGVLLIGGTSCPLNQKIARWVAHNFPQKVFYRPHPRPKRKEKISTQEKIMAKENKFELLVDIGIPMEQFILENRFSYILGAFGTLLVFTHFACKNTETIFLFDRGNKKDVAWREFAMNVGLKIIDIDKNKSLESLI